MPNTEMHPLKIDYYQSHYLATIRLLDNGHFLIEGGMKEKRSLENAKKETHFCYVKNAATGEEIKLHLNHSKWCLAPSCV